MDQSLEDRLVKRFPLIFKDYRGDMRQTCMTWGFECGDGWFKLIYDLCLDIEDLCRDRDVQVIAVQVKEKFGGLRFYYHSQLPQTFFSKISGKIRNYMFSRKLGIPYWKIIDFRKKFWKTIDEKIQDRVDKAEQDSYKICEQCGAPGKLIGKGWMYTMCSKCAEEKGVKNDQESTYEN